MSERSSEELQTLITKHLQAGLQQLQDEGVEIVVVAGTMRTPTEAYVALIQALKELRPNTKVL